MSVAGQRSPLEGVGLLIAKYPALAGGVLACALACAWAWWSRRARWTWFETAALFYTAACAASAIAASPASPFLWPWLALQVSAFVIIAAGSVACGERREVLLDGLIVIAAAVALIALFEAAGGDLPWDAGRRPGATFGNRNSVGGFCAMVAPLAVARSLARPRWWRTLMLAALLLTILLCRARSSWLALLVVGAGALSVGWYAVRRSRAAAPAPVPMRRGALACITAVILAVAALHILPWGGLRWRESSPIASSFSRLLEYESGTGQSRVVQHRVGWQMIAERPLLGSGAGAWRREGASFVHRAGDHHVKLIEPLWTPASDLLRHTVETGLLGLLAAGALVAALLAGVWRRITTPSDWIPLALVSSLAIACVIAFFDAPLSRPHSVALIAAIAGALRGHSTLPGREISGRASAAVLVAAAALAATVWLVRFAGSERVVADFSGPTVVRLGRKRFSPQEAFAVLSTRRHIAGCDELVPLATLVDEYLPYEHQVLTVLAKCAQERGSLREAESALTRLLHLEPHDAAAQAALQRLRSSP